MSLADDAFRGSDAVPGGLLTWRQLRGASWHRLFRDVYLHASIPITHEARARAATLLLPTGVVNGASAAVLWGVDQLIHAGVVDLEPIRIMAAAARGPGSARVRSVCALADGRAESPQETRLRLLMARGGLPDPVPQFVVRIDGRFIARVDFAWPDRKVAVEYDALWHAEAGRFGRDRRRLNDLHAAGWRIVFVTAPDMHREDHLVRRLATALG